MVASSIGENGILLSLVNYRGNLYILRVTLKPSLSCNKLLYDYNLKSLGIY
ncbi:hypothetical protein BD0134_04730 [Helicobacter pylori]